MTAAIIVDKKGFLFIKKKVVLKKDETCAAANTLCKRWQQLSSLIKKASNLLRESGIGKGRNMRCGEYFMQKTNKTAQF